MNEDAEVERPPIILTDAEPRLSRAAACPRCGAKATHRMPSNAFGPTYVELCGACGYNFGEYQRP